MEQGAVVLILDRHCMLHHVLDVLVVDAVLSAKGVISTQQLSYEPSKGHARLLVWRDESRVHEEAEAWP